MDTRVHESSSKITGISTMEQISTASSREGSMDLWKQGLVAPKAAATELRVAGLAQWVCFVYDRWQETSPLRARVKYL
jgi:hypothetical protein